MGMKRSVGRCGCYELRSEFHLLNPLFSSNPLEDSHFRRPLAVSALFGSGEANVQ